MNCSPNEIQKKKLTFLIVDDHDDLRQSLLDWIRSSFSNSQIFSASDGREAFSLAVFTRPDIVLMDIEMSEMNGIEATKMIKKALPKTQVVIITVHDGIDYRTSAIQAGASAFISKQNMGSQLIGTLRNLIKKNCNVIAQ